MQEEEGVRPAVAGVVLERLGVAELEAHIGALRREIERAEAEIRRKRALQSAADGVFRFPAT